MIEYYDKNGDELVVSLLSLIKERADRLREEIPSWIRPTGIAIGGFLAGSFLPSPETWNEVFSGETILGAATIVLSGILGGEIARIAGMRLGEREANKFLQQAIEAVEGSLERTPSKERDLNFQESLTQSPLFLFRTEARLLLGMAAQVQKHIGLRRVRVSVPFV